MNEQREDNGSAGHQRLRQLIIGSNQVDRLDDPRDEAERVASVISEAIKQRGKEDDSVGEAMSDSLDTALKKAIEKNPQPIVDTLMPIIGPALRQSINTAISQMVVTLNQVLENSLSFRFIFWRFQAWRLGKNYAEFVLLKTIQYRIEQIILIDRTTSLVIATESISESTQKDVEQVSAMLSAISDFVTDSFNQDSQSILETINSGDLTLEISSNANTVLVAVVRGVAGPDIRNLLAQTLETLHRDHQDPISQFQGEQITDNALNETLRSCLLEKRIDDEPKDKKSPWLAWAVLSIAFIAICYGSFLHWQRESQQSQIIDALREEVGYSVISHQRSAKKLRITIIRSPESQDVLAVINGIEHDLELDIDEHYVPVDDASWYGSYLRDFLKLDERHQISHEGKRLLVSGPLTQEQLGQLIHAPKINDFFTEVAVEKSTAPLDKPTTPGVKLSYSLNDAAKQKPTAQIPKLETLVTKLNGINVLFPPSATRFNVNNNTSLVEAVRICKEIQSIMKEKGRTFPDLLIMGYSDNSTPNTDINRKVAFKRAKFVQRLLIENGIPSSAMVITAMPTLAESSLSFSQQRRVSFHVAYFPDVSEQQ